MGTVIQTRLQIYQKDPAQGRGVQIYRGPPATLMVTCQDGQACRFHGRSALVNERSFFLTGISETFQDCKQLYRSECRKTARLREQGDRLLPRPAMGLSSSGSLEAPAGAHQTSGRAVSARTLAEDALEPHVPISGAVDE